MTTRFTGYHITAILVAFFGIIIAVNFVMAFAATRTFGGLLAKNGYVASRDYNSWIAASETQDRLGWSIESHVADSHLVLTVEGVKNPQLRVVAEHPLGGEPAREIKMAQIGENQFRSQKTIAKGRWKIRIGVRQGTSEARFLREIRR